MSALNEPMDIHVKLKDEMLQVPNSNISSHVGPLSCGFSSISEQIFRQTF